MSAGVDEIFDRDSMVAMAGELTRRTRNDPSPVFEAIRREMRDHGADPGTWAVALL